MIFSLIVFTLIVSALVTLMGYAVARICGILGWPRRFAWLISLGLSLALPAALLLQRAVSSSPTALGPLTSYTTDQLAPSETLGPPSPIGYALPSWPSAPTWDPWLLVAWLIASLGMLSFLGFAYTSLRRSSGDWKASSLLGEPVALSNSYGPAVIGFLHPKIVIPQWLFNEDQVVQEAILAHEREHIRLKDQLVLLAGVLCLCATPWNPLSWLQFWRLRFALEVDCDSRVVRSGVDVTPYGQALVRAAEVRSASYPWALALIEPRSILERRITIMLSEPTKSRWIVLVLCSLGALGAAGVTSQLQAPSLTELPKKLPPTYEETPNWIRRAEQLVGTKYPELVRENTPGTPVVSILFSADGGIEQSDYFVFAASAREYEVGDEHFYRFGVLSEEVGPTVATTMVFATDKSNEVLVLATERLSTKGSSLYPVFPDTGEVDRQLVDHYFPDLREGDAEKGEQIWLLFDRDGNVLRSGREYGADSVRHAVERRFPGLLIQEQLATPVTLSSGSSSIEDESSVTLYSLWTAPSD